MELPRLAALFAALSAIASTTPVGFNSTALVRRDSVVCQTSSGSPSAADCQTAINEVTGDTTCSPLNPYGSGCAGIFSHGTCSIVVCIDDSDDNDITIERNVALGQVQTLLDDCQSNGLVGGYYHMDSIPDSQCTNGGYYGYANIEFVHT